MNTEPRHIEPKHICAFIDAQGFHLNNRFYLRELAIKNDTLDSCVEFDAELYLNRVRKDQRQQLIYQTNSVHGIPITSCRADFRSCEASTVIKSWYEIVATEEKVYFGLKNQQLATILNQVGIPFVDFERREIRAPSLRQLDQAYSSENPVTFCKFHTRLPRHNNIELRCAQRKANRFWEWLRNPVQLTAPQPQMDVVSKVQTWMESEEFELHAEDMDLD